MNDTRLCLFLSQQNQPTEICSANLSKDACVYFFAQAEELIKNVC